MPVEPYEPSDRRPLASRELKVWQRTAAALAKRGVSANSISIVGMAVGVAAGFLLALTQHADGDVARRLLWFAGAVGIQLRLLANMLDGMVALAGNQASRLGELYNELPDRVSDVAIIIGAGYAAGGVPALGYIAACVAVLTAYVRAVGKAAGASDLFVGPMAKPHRMFTLTVVAVLMALLPEHWQPSWGQQHAGLPALGLLAIIVGGIITMIRRLQRIVRHLKRPA